MAQSTPGPTVKTGWFMKRGGTRNKSYKSRFFVLKASGDLFYFKKDNDNKPQGCIPLAHMIKIVGDDHDKNDLERYSIAIITMDRIWELKFESDEHRSGWVQAMRDAAPRIPDGLLEDGFLMIKEPRKTGTWKRRYFAVFGYHVFIFKNMEDFDKWHRRMASEIFNPIATALADLMGAIYLQGCHVKQDRNTKEGYGFQVKVLQGNDAAIYEFCANSRRERTLWMEIMFNIARGAFPSLEDVPGAYQQFRQAMPSQQPQQPQEEKHVQPAAPIPPPMDAGGINVQLRDRGPSEFSQPIAPNRADVDYQADSEEEEEVDNPVRNYGISVAAPGMGGMPQPPPMNMGGMNMGMPQPPMNMGMSQPPMNMGMPQPPPMNMGMPQPPPMAQPPPQQPPPVQWKTAKDPKGRTYWYHPITKETSWTNPSED